MNNKACGFTSMNTASLRHACLSAWLAVVYLALPGCGFAILIFGPIGVHKISSARVLYPWSSPSTGALLAVIDKRITGSYNLFRRDTIVSWRVSLQEGFEVGRAAIHRICLLCRSVASSKAGEGQIIQGEFPWMAYCGNTTNSAKDQSTSFPLPQNMTPTEAVRPTGYVCSSHG